MEKKDLELLFETSERSKNNSNRLSIIEDKVEDIHSLTLSVHDIATEVKMMREDLIKIDKRVLAIEDKPIKKMEQVWGYIMSSLIGGLIGYILLSLGLK